MPGSSAPRRADRIVAWWLARDPHGTGFLRGLRAAVAATLVYAVGLSVVDNPNFAISAAFSALSALIFADYGGGRRARTWAYVHLAWVGALVLAVGLLVANTTWLAVGLTFVVVAVIRFVGNLGPQLHASVSPLILGFVLGVLVPGPLSAIAGRVAGWVAGVAVAAVAAAVIKPGRTSDDLDRTAGAAATALGRCLRSVVDPEADRDAAREVQARVHQELAALRTMTLRPAGPRANTVARRAIVDRLVRLSAIVGRSLAVESFTVDAAVLALAEADAQLLEAIGAALTDPTGASRLDGPLATLEQARDATFDDLRSQIRDGRDAELILDDVDHGFVVRAASVHSEAVAKYVQVLHGEVGVAPTGTRVDRVDLPEPSLPGATRRVRDLLTHHAGLESVWTRDALRAGIALALAVTIGDAFVSQHAFWVALGTLSVLRSNALTTGQTAVGAAVGTAVGFALSSLVFAVVGLDTIWLWPILVVAIFAIGALPSVAGFAAGQAAFSIAVIVLFNIVEPLGWKTGLVRLENVALGAAVSAVVALVFWPRRVEGLVRQLTAAFGAAAGEGLVHVVGRRSKPDGPAGPDPLEGVKDAEARARAAVGELTEEYRNAPALVATWVQRVGVAAHARSVAQAIDRLEHRFPEGAHPTPLDPELEAAATQIAEDLAAGEGSPTVPRSADLNAGLRAAALSTITADRARPEAVASSLFVRDWLLTLAGMVDGRP